MNKFQYFLMFIFIFLVFTFSFFPTASALVWNEPEACKLTGCTMEGDINMGNHSIINVTWVNMTYINAAEITGDYLSLRNLDVSENANMGNLSILSNLSVDSNVLFVDSNTNRVGIGTATPTATLQVEATLDPYIKLQDTGSGYMNFHQYATDSYIDVSDNMEMRYLTLERFGFSLTEVVANEDSGDVDFRVESNDNAAMFFVDGGENRVGIGLTAPASLLHVYSATTGTIKLETGGGNSVPQIQLINDAYTWVLKNDGASGDSFMIRGGSTFSNKLIIDLAGNIIFNEDSLDADFRVESANESNMFFVNGGTNNVGIGTNAPAQKLEIVSAGHTGLGVKTTGENFNPYYRLWNDNRTLTMKLKGLAGNDEFIIEDLTNDVMFSIDRLGKVGIGTATPSSMLTVAQGTNVNEVNLSNVLYVNSTSGRVGIGTATPVRTLHVLSATNAQPMTIEEPTSATTGQRPILELKLDSTGDAADTFGPMLKFTIRDDADADYVIGEIATVQAGAANTGDMVFNTYLGGAMSEKVRITGAGTFTTAQQTNLNEVNLSNVLYVNSTSGFVGIGTASPLKLLHLDTPSGTEVYMRLKQGGTYWDVGRDAGSNILRFRYGGAEKFRFWNTGNFEIYDGNAIVNGDISATENITSANVFIPQDIGVRTNMTIPVRGANLWTNITFEQQAGEISQGILHTYNDLTNDTFTFTEDGLYEFDYDLDVEDTSPSASDIDVAGRLIFENGTEVIGSVFETDITKQGAEVELSHNYFFWANAGDSIIVQFVADDPQVQISTHGAFGDYPDSATFILSKERN